MNIALFHDIFKLINTSSSNNIEEGHFLLFLLGGYMDKNLYDYKEITDCLEYHASDSYISLHSIFGHRFSKSLNLHINHKLTLNDLIKIIYEENFPLFQRTKETILSYENEISGLYEKYALPMPKKENPERLFQRLWAFCITEHIPTLFSSYRNQKLKPSTISSTLGRDDDAANLKKILMQNHKVIISGQYGIGKTRFIQYCLSKWDIADYCIIDYNTDLESTLSIIRYQDIIGYEYTDSSDSGLFNEIFSSSLLIIDNMYFSPDFPREIAYLAKMSLNIIVITTNPTLADIHSSFQHYELSALPNDILYQIFEHDSCLPLKDKHLQKSLSQVTCNNALLVSLIAFQCKKLSCSFEGPDKNASIIEQVITELSKLNNHMNLGSSQNNYNFKHQYDKKTLNLLGHVKNIYNYILDEIEKSSKLFRFTEFMKQLSCFGWTPIPLKFIISIIPLLNQNSLEQLSEMGLITLTEENVHISPLISHAVFATGVLPADYDSLVEKMQYYLNNYDRTLDIPYLSNILYTFFASLYKQIKEKNNPNQNETASRFENWQKLAYAIVTYYNQNGDLELAQKVTNMIKYPASLINAHNAFDKQLIDLSNKMQIQSELDNMIPSIDKLICELDGINQPTNLKISEHDLNLHLSTPIDLTLLISNALDNTINQLCLLFLKEHSDSQTNSPIFKHVLALNKLLYIIQHNSYMESSLSNEHLAFYSGCHWIINKPTISKFDLEESLNIINSWDNMNFRIRGLAFIIFWESEIAYNNHDLKLFTDSILPNINCLIQLIHNCRLIPAQTFRQCLYSYINTAMVQQTFIQCEKLNLSKDLNFFTPETFRDLFNRCNLTRNDLESLMVHMDPLFSSMESILK